MAYKEQLKKVGEYEYELLKTGKMLVPAKIFISPKLLELVEETAMQQIVNVATLPGIVKHSLALADMHSGYGFPIGGVAAFDLEKGVISPGGVGYDINCSVRLLKTNLKLEDIERKKKEIIDALFKSVPSGVGRGGAIKISKQDIKEILETGANWAVKNGYGTLQDLEYTEESGCMKDADASCVSERAIARGLPQLGSLGSGNHFLEVQKVEEIYDEKIAEKFGLKKGYVTIMIHCGSRGLGHQVASDYIKLMEDKFGFENLPDRELINAPINSDLGKKYYKAMCAAANFAFCNKQMITEWVRETLKEIFPSFSASVVYDICHNIAKFEEHVVDGKKLKLCIHRKGATRSFGPGRKEIPEKYRSFGQPVIIPGSMGTSSYVLVGTKKAEEVSFASTAHGAGRVSSRSFALRNLRGEDIKNQLAKQGIEVKSGSWKSIAEEAPQVYKDIDEVVKVSHEAGIGNLVAKLKPVAVMKG